MPISKARYILAASIAACSIPLPATAQHSPSETPEPPRLERLEEGHAPAVTAGPTIEPARIDEKRARGGRVTEIRVTNGNSTYYVPPGDPASNAWSNTNRAARWQVLQFGSGPSKEAREAQASETAVAVPPPAAPASSAPRNK